MYLWAAVQGAVAQEGFGQQAMPEAATASWGEWAAESLCGSEIQQGGVSGTALCACKHVAAEAKTIRKGHLFLPVTHSDAFIF